MHDLDEHGATLRLTLLLCGIGFQGGGDAGHQSPQLRQVYPEQTCTRNEYIIQYHLSGRGQRWRLLGFIQQLGCIVGLLKYRSSELLLHF